MRPTPLLPAALLVLTIGACTPAADRSEQTAFQVPKRDLTLQQADAPGLDVASSVELRQAPLRQAALRERRRARRPRPAVPSRAERVHPAAAPAPTPVRATPVPASQPAAKVAAPATPEGPPDPYALAPGQTITVLPVSNAGSSDAAPGIEPSGPADRRGGSGHGGGGHGGSCGGGGGRHGGGGWGGTLR
jgi:uncharacterized membrane protein YgcG